MDRTNYMMTVEDVAVELGVSHGHAYKLIRQLNQELLEAGYITIAGKIPRTYWQTKFFGYNQQTKLV